MGRNKLSRFADNVAADNVIQAGKELFSKIKGQWRSLYFKNEQALVLELGCGRGEYTVGLGALFPKKNYVGIDIKGSRIWKGSQMAIEQNLQNVAFLRIQIQHLDIYFAENEVDEIWVTFPDPRPKDSDEKRRLTHPRFLAMYEKLLKPGGLFHLKTDNELLFEYTLEEIQKFKISDFKFTRDLYKSELNALHHGLKTRYEQMFFEQGYSIKYLQCRMGV